MTQRINEKLGAWLLQEGHSQTLLADEIGITRPTLSSRLSGKSKWNWGEVVRVAEITSTSLDELAGINT